MKMKLPIIAIMLFSFMSACISDNEERSDEIVNKIKIGDIVPQFIVLADGDKTFNSNEFKGKRSLLVFFHTSCGDCQRELPLVEEVYRQLSDDPSYLIITVARQQSYSDVEKYWTAQKFTMPKYIDTDRSVYTLFANSVIPRLYVIDPEGKVIWMAIEKTNVNASQLIDLIKNQ